MPTDPLNNIIFIVVVVCGVVSGHASFDIHCTVVINAPPHLCITMNVITMATILIADFY